MRKKLYYWLSLVLIFTIPWENIVSNSSFGTISRIAGILTTVVWLVAVLLEGKFRKLHTYHYIFFLFVLWNFASVFWSINPEKTLDRLLTYFQLCIFVILIWDIYSTPTLIRAGLQAYIFGAYISIINTIQNYSSNQAFYSNRFSASGFNPNDLAIILVFGLPAAWYLVFDRKEMAPSHPLLKLVNILYLPAATFAIFLTASRAGIISVFIFIISFIISLFWMKLVYRWAIILFSVIFIFLIQLFIPQSTIDILQNKQLDLNGRSEIWRTGMTILTEHPFLGIGSNTFNLANTDTRKVAHNIFLSLSAELGLIGLFLFLILMAVLFYSVLTLPRQDAIFWMTFLIIWTLGATTHNLETRKQTWLFMTLLVSYTRCSFLILKQMRVSSLPTGVPEPPGKADLQSQAL